MKIAYFAKKGLIRTALMRYATANPMVFPTYEQLGRQVGIPTRGPWKPILDLISQEETAQGLPDITFLVISKITLYPSQIGFTSSKNPTPQQKLHARQKIQAVINKYNPGTPNPF